jgi:hypothetical protein
MSRSLPHEFTGCPHDLLPNFQESRMLRIRLKDILTGTALAMILAGTAAAAPDTPPEVQPIVRAAEPSNVLPTPAADVAAPAAAPVPASPTTAAPAGPPFGAKSESVRQPDRATIQGLTGKELIKAPLATELAAADVPVAEKLRDLLAAA